MKIPLKYEKTIIEMAFKENLGLEKIDLDSPKNVEKAILLILELLGLEKFLQIQEPFGSPYDSKLTHEERVEHYYKVRFTLNSIEQVTKEQFRESIIKFQDFLITDNKRKKTETETAIENIQKMISTLSNSEFEFLIGITYSDEGPSKAKCNQPVHWYFYSAKKYEYAREVYNYFIRNGLKSNENGGTYPENVYFFAKRK